MRSSLACGALAPSARGDDDARGAADASEPASVDALGFSLSELSPAQLAQRRLCAASDFRRRPFWAAVAGVGAAEIAERGIRAVLLGRHHPPLASASASSFVPSLAPLGWSGYLPRGSKELLRKGVPPELRARVWLALSGGERKRVESGPGAYAALSGDASASAGAGDALDLGANSKPHSKLQQPQGGGASVPAAVATTAEAVSRADAGQIELDLDRTFPGNAWVSSREGQDALRRVLHAFARRARAACRVPCVTVSSPF